MQYPLLTPFNVTKLAMSGKPISKLAYEILEISELGKEYGSFDEAYDDARRFNRGKKSRSSSEREIKGKGQRTKITKRPYAGSSTESDSESENASTNDNEDLSPEIKLSKEKSRKKSSKIKSKQRLKSNSEEGDHYGSDEEMLEQSRVTTQAASKAARTKAAIAQHSERVTSLPLPSFPENFEEPRLRETHATSNLEPKISDSNSSFLQVELEGPTELASPLKTHGKKHSSESSKKSTKQVHSMDKHLFADTINKNRCKVGKKTKHPCGFRLSCSKEEAILHTLCSIGSSVEELKFLVKRVKQKDGSYITKEVEPLEEVYLPADIEQLLPFKDNVALKNFEEKLMKENEILKTTVNAFAWKHRNDSNITNTTRGLAREILCESVLALYSLKGGHQKKAYEKKKLPFNESIIYTLIVDVVGRIWKKSVDSYKCEVDKTLGPFFTQLNKPATEVGKQSFVKKMKQL